MKLCVIKVNRSLTQCKFVYCVVEEVVEKQYMYRISEKFPPAGFEPTTFRTGVPYALPSGLSPCASRTLVKPLYPSAYEFFTPIDQFNMKDYIEPVYLVECLYISIHSYASTFYSFPSDLFTNIDHIRVVLKCKHCEQFTQEKRVWIKIVPR